MTSVTATDARAIKLHTDSSGIVWFADGDRVPMSSGNNVSDFVPTLHGRSRLLVRVLGTPTNAALVMRLRALVEDNDGRLEVASPVVCGGVMERTEPATALLRMRQNVNAASLGGWHKVTQADYATYALAAQLHRDMQFLDSSKHLLYRHPVWKHLSFVGGVSEEWAAWLISTIIDPRWYIDPDKPNRLSKLKSYLGLDPKTIQSVLANNKPTTNREFNCRVTYATWAMSGAPDTYLLKSPENFIWRVYFGAGLGNKGALRASQKFIEFLTFTWLHALRTNTPTYGAGQPIFIPEMLLKSPDEVSAYESHIR